MNHLNLLFDSEWNDFHISWSWWDYSYWNQVNMIELFVDTQNMLHDVQWCILGLNKNINKKYSRIILLWNRIMGQDPSSLFYILVNAPTSIVPKYKTLILVRRSLILSYNGLSFPWDWFCDHHYFCSKENSNHNSFLRNWFSRWYIPIIYYLSYIMHYTLYLIVALSGLIGKINHESSAFCALSGLIGKLTVNHRLFVS